MSTAPQTAVPTSRHPVDGKVALVTGGSRGIGLAIAEALVAEGAYVVITGRDRAQLRSASTHVKASADRRDAARVHDIEADVRSAPDVERAVRDSVDRFGGLDVLINNAGVGLFGHVADMSPTDWNQVIETNLTGVFHCCRAAIPELRRRGGGWIINISSLAGSHPSAGSAAYCASKAALNAFTEALMQEVRHDNIRVSCIAPGSVSTGFASRGASGEAEWKLAPEDVARLVVDLIAHPARSLPSRVEVRPSRPKK